MRSESRRLIETIIRTTINDAPLTFKYKNGRGKFSINMQFILSYTQTEFKKLCTIVADADDNREVAGYINSILRSVYEEVNRANKNIIPKYPDDDVLKKDLADYAKRIEKLHDILNKFVEVAPLTYDSNNDMEVQEVENIGSELLTPLKRCNVKRFIPTQIKPVWENGKVETKIGYSFEYRGMPLQAITNRGWVNSDYPCKVFIIDPVVGLPVASYDGTLADIEDKLSEVFIGYLKTIESNKEYIVQIATAFNKLKETA